MILPIVGYGHPTLKKKAKPITPDYPELEDLLENMFETMYNALGVGLAAPQVNLPIRIFVVDGSELEGDGEDMTGFKKVFINPEKIEETGPEWTFEEGCLSIPDIRENVRRPGDIRLRYFDENFHEITEEFGGMKARIIQHEYDHIEGILFVDRLKPLKKKLLKKKLSLIKAGKVNADYRMRFA